MTIKNMTFARRLFLICKIP